MAIGLAFVDSANLDPRKVVMATFICFCSAIQVIASFSSVPNIEIAKRSANKIFSIIDQPSLIDVRDKKQITSIQEGKITFKNVNFKYPNSKIATLRNLTMEIEPGKKIGLVGHSGAGKSTIANLILRFFDIQSGDIFIDGIKIEEYDVGCLRRQIGTVMQQTHLFNESIKENILFG